MKGNRPRNPNSEVACALRMREIEIKAKWMTLSKPFYDVHEVAERYYVHVQTVYRGMKAKDPMYPFPETIGNGPRPRLRVSREALEACDQRRIQFYRTTPSWLPNGHPQRPEKFTRTNARKVLGPTSN